MTDPASRITIERLMADTGLGPRQARADVRAGLLPGRMRGSRYVCSPGEYHRWLRGDWQPKSQTASEPIQMIHKRSA